MKIINKILVSEDLFDNYFCCDLEKCEGMCCIEGDAGAPIEADEIGDIEDNYPIFKKYMTKEGIEKVETDGSFDYDMEGSFVTPLLKDEACAYVYYEDGIAKCAMEKAFLMGETKFIKPISCHLYPIRIKKLQEYEALNYHRWFVCSPACEKGEKLKIPVFQFLKEPIIRKYGKHFYEQLDHLYEKIDAAGGIVYNDKNEVLMIFRRSKWDFPKGKVEPGESIEEAALRETEEECGITNLEIISALPNTFHTYTIDDKLIAKTTYWFEMKYSGEKPPTPQTEEDITAAQWVPISMVDNLLKDSYPTLKNLWRKICR